jgi:hypothetical protein
LGRHTVLWLSCGGFVALAWLSGDRIEIEFDSPDVIVNSWSWWGLSRDKTPIYWRENQWMRKNEKGEWEIAVVEPEYDGPEDPRR